MSTKAERRHANQKHEYFMQCLQGRFEEFMEELIEKYRKDIGEPDEFDRNALTSAVLTEARERNRYELIRLDKKWGKKKLAEL